MAAQNEPLILETTTAPPTPLREFWSYFSDNPGAVAGLVVLFVIVLLAVFADVISPHSPIATHDDAFLKPPFWEEGGTLTYPLGTDAIGRDMLSRLVHGTRYSLLIGSIVVLISLTLGVVIGLTAGFFQGVVGILIMRLMDVILTIPGLLLAIVIVAILGPGLTNAMISVAIVYLPYFVRITRAAVIGELAKDYVTASRVNGASTPRLMFMTVLPNCLAPLIVQATLSFSAGIIDAAALGFLGLGAQPPTPEWGTMLADFARIRAARLVGGDAARPRHPDHRSRGEPDGGRLARRARSEAQTLMALLEMAKLSVDFPTSRGTLKAVDGVGFSVEEGDILGIVGESGSGKSVAMLALMGLVAYPGIVKAERLVFGGRDLLTLSARERRRIAGKDIAMIFQEPMTSLNPCFTIGYQIMETLRIHEGGTRRARRERAIALLEQVGIPAPAGRLAAFPHQLSGGMNQRVMIAIAIACNPRLLIADEPTTALDVTIQAQILELLMSLQRERGMALILITHDMGVVAETAERVIVMYAGQIVEEAPAKDLFAAPRHPYTAALLAALPERSRGERRLPTISGLVPGLGDRPSGCLFNPRCAYADARCRSEEPLLEGFAGSGVRCHYPLSGAPQGSAP